MSSTKSTRGIISIAAVGIILLVGLLVYPTYKVIKGLDLFPSDSKAKKEVVQLTADQQHAQQAERDAATARAAKDANDQAIATQKAAIVDDGHQDIVGVRQALIKEQTPSINVQVASMLAADADRALPPLAQARIDQMQVIVNQLTSQNAADKIAAQAQLDKMTDQLNDSKDKVRTLSDKQTVLNGQVKDAETKALSLQDKVTEDAGKLRSWAADNKGLIARVASLTLWLGVLIGMIALFHWLLPLIGLAFPAAAPLAKGLAAILAYPLHALHTAEKAALSAAHAMTTAKLASATTQLASETAAHQTTTAALIQVALTSDSAPSPQGAALVAASAAAAVAKSATPPSSTPTTPNG